MTQLIELLSLEQVTDDIYIGHSPAEAKGRIFGGQVVAQALAAAYETVPEFLCHSLHAYFIHPGDPLQPVRFEVARLRDSRSFSTRSINAVQDGKVILCCNLSFHVAADGLEHHQPMPNGVPHPESLRHDDPRGYDLGIELRSCHPPKPGLVADVQPPVHQLWCRSWRDLGENPRHHQAALAYASDFPFLSTIVQPHPVKWSMPELQVASLDHSLWFHRPLNFNNWHFFDLDSPSTFGERGIARGVLYDEFGVPVASATQEGLIRLRNRK